MKALNIKYHGNITFNTKWKQCHPSYPNTRREVQFLSLDGSETFQNKKNNIKMLNIYVLLLNIFYSTQVTYPSPLGSMIIYLKTVQL